MQTPTLLAFHRLASDQITDIDHVTQLAYLLIGLDAFEQIFGLFVQQIQTFPCTAQTQIRTHDTDICGHDLSYFLHILRNQYPFFVTERSLIVPCRDLGVEVVLVDHAEAVFGSRVGIDHGFNQTVRCQTVTTMQTCARALTYGVQTFDT